MGSKILESRLDCISKASLVFLFVLVFWGAPAWSQVSELDKSQPMHIEADKVVYGQKERKLDFIGQVYVKRPDFELWCQKMVVTLSAEDQGEEKQGDNTSSLGAAGSVRKIVAQDNVRLVMDNREATSERAEYYARESKLILVENVQIQENKNVVRGHKVTFYLDAGRSEIEGKEGSRVRAVFFPDQEEQDEQ